MDPTDFDLEAYVYAVESYQDHERYGLPYEWGSMDQPWVWLLATGVVIDAIAAAQAQARSEARHDREG